MKGLVFREFIDMVEDVYGDEVLDEIVEGADLPVSGGAYSAVGTYPFEEMLELLGRLSARVETPTEDLLRAFGRHLFGQFYAKYPRFFEGVGDTYDFVERVDGHIHEEVKKLYPDAELPRFGTTRAQDRLVVEYSSSRALSDLAHGLLEACSEHFGARHRIHREPTTEDGTRVTFTLEPAP